MTEHQRKTHARALKSLESAVASLPMDDRTMWLESIMNITRLLDRYPKLTLGVTRTMVARFKLEGMKR